MLYSEDDYKRKQAREQRAEEAATAWAQAVQRADDSGLLMAIHMAWSTPLLPLLYVINGPSWRDMYRRS